MIGVWGLGELDNSWRLNNKNNWKYISNVVLCLVAPLGPTLCDPMDCTLPGSSVRGDSPGKNTGVVCHALLQGIFPTQGSKPHLLQLLHWQVGSLSPLDMICYQVLICLAGSFFMYHVLRSIKRISISMFIRVNFLKISSLNSHDIDFKSLSYFSLFGCA